MRVNSKISGLVACGDSVEFVYQAVFRLARSPSLDDRCIYWYHKLLLVSLFVSYPPSVLLNNWLFVFVYCMLTFDEFIIDYCFIILRSMFVVAIYHSIQQLLTRLFWWVSEPHQFTILSTTTTGIFQNLHGENGLLTLFTSLVYSLAKSISKKWE